MPGWEIIEQSPYWFPPFEAVLFRLGIFGGVTAMLWFWAERCVPDLKQELRNWGYRRALERSKRLEKESQ